MRAWPIRLKFACWTAGLVAFSLLVYSGFTLANLYDEQIEAVDLELAADGHRLSGIAEPAQIRALLAEDERYAPWLGYALFDEVGHLTYLSQDLPEMTAREALTQDRHHSAKDEKGRWRIGMFPGHNATLVVAYNLAEIRGIMMDLVLAYSFALPLVVCLAAVGGWWISGRVLQPVRDLATTVERIQAGSLDHRVPIPTASDEIQRLSTVFNAMMARLEASFGQARRFAADASHELRTPLTILRGEIDRLLLARGILPEHQEKLVSVQEEIERLQHITDNLLLLALFDSGHVRIEDRPVDVSALVKTACEDAELLAATAGIQIERHLADGLFVRGDASHLRRAILNLLDNALKFNEPNGRIRCALGEAGGRIVLRIANTGPGISTEAKPRLFHRFFRADPSRGDAQRGHGLGLSLSREIVHAHGGELALSDLPDPGWTEFILTLPQTPSPIS